MGYFEDQNKEINLRVKDKEDSPGLRECQMGAFWAICAHFTASNSPALIVMPTGSGKTAVMILLAFGLRASRVLVITPAVILRDQTAGKFRSLDDLIREKVLPQNVKKPSVHIQEGRTTSAAVWNKLRRYEVVVATPHTLSPEQHEDIVPPPDDLFDIVFFDEAHHTPARTWDALLKAFKASKCILLTATPFRQDKRRVRAHMVYNYPLGRAIDSGIYRPVEYQPVTVPFQGVKDELICKKAKELLAEEKKKQHRTKILVRTDKVRESKRLISLYRSHGILIDEVNYEKKLQENKAVLDAIEHDKLDGVVCVGMLGEGLDLPELKIAALHDPPLSLPFTLQFIGRVSRPVKGQIGEAHVIANPDDVKGEMRKLYRRNARWRDLVPKLVDEAVGEIAEQSKFHQDGLIVGDLDVDPREIAPFFSARLYNVRPDDLDLAANLDLGDKIDIPFAEHLDDDNLLVLITESETRPPWAASLALDSIRYDLHLYYYHRASKTLFESTTSDIIAAEIRRQVVSGEIEHRGGEELIRVMQSNEPVNYLMVGMGNVLGQSPSLPTYKILMGKEVQNAVRPSEGRVFAPGHVLAKVSRNETRGVANSRGRVWAIKRASLLEYKNWCEAIGNQLVSHPSATTYPGMEFLSNARRVRELLDRPIAVLFDYSTFRYSLMLVKTDRVSHSVAMEMSCPQFDGVRVSKDRRTVSVHLCPDGNIENIVPLTYDIANNTWTVETETTYIVSVDTGLGVRIFALEEFLSEYPPVICLGNGGVVRNGELYQPKPSVGELPERCYLKGIDWSACDITVESADQVTGRLPGDDKLTIHDFLEEKLKSETGDNALVLKDHGSGEIADFVAIEPENKTVAFFHCKAAHRNTPSVRITDLKVLEQVIRSVNWIRNSDLLHEIVVRAISKSRPNSKLVKGGIKMAEHLAEDFRSNEWQYQVVIVQPGLDCQKIYKRKNANTLLINCFEWLDNLGASLLIMGQ